MSSNFCIVCGIDLGEMNPRQLCGKYYCENQEYSETDTEYSNDMTYSYSSDDSETDEEDDKK